MYAKVFSSLWQGTLYGLGDVQLVFIYLLAHADSDGNVRCVVPAIAAATGLTVERVRAAIDVLEGADADSNTSDNDGRRIERIGNCDRWNILNYLKYRAMRDVDERQRQTREAVKRHRLKAKVSQGKPRKAQEEAEAEAEEDKDTPLVPSGTVWARLFDEFWTAYPHWERRSLKAKALKRWNALRGKVPAAALMAALAAAKTTEDWRKDGGRFIPGAHVWLNEGWDASDGVSAGADPEDARQERIKRMISQKLEVIRAGT